MDSSTKKRWNILKQTILKKGSQARQDSQVSRRTTSGFGLVSSLILPSTSAVATGPAASTSDDRNWQVVEYTLPNRTKIQLRQRKEDAFDLNDFKVSQQHRIDNTGVVCLWPAEEVLTDYCIKNQEFFRGKRVLELGAGAGLAGLALASLGVARELVLTDGNPIVVETLRANIARNKHLYPRQKVKAGMLHWDKYKGDLGRFDVIIAADCTFFKEFHGALAGCTRQLLRAGGRAIMLNPPRGGTLDKFVGALRGAGLRPALHRRYDDALWDAHLRLTAASGTADQGWPAYEEDTCYPILLDATLEDTASSSTHNNPLSFLKVGLTVACAAACIRVVTKHVRNPTIF